MSLRRYIGLSIIYKCRHCDHVIGKLEQKIIDTQLLGLQMLSTEEKKQMVRYEDNGDIYIQSICENCEETLENNPHYHELDFFLQ
mgnify:CR=1 FL=1